MTATRSTGFYGTADSTYYVTGAGEVYCVQTDDLRDCPFPVAEVPAEAVECDDLIDGEEQAAHIRRIEAD